MDNYEIILSKHAHLTFKRNIKFLNKFNISYANRIKNSIQISIQNIKKFPYSFPIFKITKKNIYRKLIIKNCYLIIFTIKKRKILIYYILDGRQSYIKYFNSLK